MAGDTLRLSFALKNPNGTAVNLTSYTGSWQIRVRPESSATVASSTGGSPNATLTFASDRTTGIFDIATNALTVAGLYYYDVELVSPNSVRETIVRGHIRVVPEVTR